MKWWRIRKSGRVSFLSWCLDTEEIQKMWISFFDNIWPEDRTVVSQRCCWFRKTQLKIWYGRYAMHLLCVFDKAIKTKVVTRYPIDWANYHPVEGAVSGIFSASKNNVLYILSVVNQIGLPCFLFAAPVWRRSFVQVFNHMPFAACCEHHLGGGKCGGIIMRDGLGASSVVGVRQNNGNLKSWLVNLPPPNVPRPEIRV